MIRVIIVGLVLMCLCLALQAFFAVVAVRWMKHWQDRPMAESRRFEGFRRILTITIAQSIGMIIQMAAWALLYRSLGFVADFEEGLYFSGVTYTSLGYGDVVIKSGARFLAPMEAMTGLMMVAIVTAVLINAITRLSPNRQG